jgi:hypothetical protein
MPVSARPARSAGTARLSVRCNVRTLEVLTGLCSETMLEDYVADAIRLSFKQQSILHAFEKAGLAPVINEGKCNH